MPETREEVLRKIKERAARLKRVTKAKPELLTAISDKSKFIKRGERAATKLRGIGPIGMIFKAADLAKALKKKRGTENVL